MNIKNSLRTALVIFAALTILTGGLYPLAITALSQVIFPAQANGSLLYRNGDLVGSRLIGQKFDAPEYFWGRLSSTSPFEFNPSATVGSNLSPLNPALVTKARERIDALKQEDAGLSAPMPVDLVTASGSGLDPHISPAAARIQIPRVAKARGISESDVRNLVAQSTEGRQFGFLGEPRVNVLLLNAALDSTASK